MTLSGRSSSGLQLTCMQNIMNMSGTCPPHMKPRKLPINTKVDTVLILKDLILLICSANITACGWSKARRSHAWVFELCKSGSEAVFRLSQHF